MNKSPISLNVAIRLSVIAFLTGIARLILDVGFVPEVYTAMPADKPGQVALVMLVFTLVFGLWLWALLAASHNSRRGLIGLLICNLILAFAWGVSTLTTFCPIPCPVVSPLTDIVTLLNVLTGVISAVTIGIYVVSKPHPTAELRAKGQHSV